MTNKSVFYDEIETLRIKYEHGKEAAWKYQEKCEKVSGEFTKNFIEKNVRVKRDLDSSGVKEFVEFKNYRSSNISFDNASFGMAVEYDEMSEQTKALYYCIK